MKLGEIKLEALMMIYPGEVFNVDIDNLESAMVALKGDPNFADYLANMPGIINRCFGVLEQREVLPTKQAELSLAQGENLGPYLRYRINERIEDLRAIEKVIYADGESYEDMCDYRRESQYSILVPFKKQGRYIFVYTPKIPRISVLTSESTEILEGREDIASLIPYFVKAELLVTEHPDDSQMARSLFESALNNLLPQREGHQSAVENVYNAL